MMRIKKLSSGIPAAVNIILWLYLVFIGLIYPLYIPGYYMLGFEKFLIWRTVSLIMMGIVLFLLALKFAVTHSGDLPAALKALPNRIISSMNLRDRCVCAYAVALTVSFIFNRNPEDALWGAFGWHMGYLTQLVMIGWYFLYAKRFRWKPVHFWILVSGALCAFAAGILQRFGIIEIDGVSGRYEMLSTIGNINWYCGFQAALIPAVCALACSLKERVLSNLITFLLVLLCTLSLFTNGSSAAYPIMAGILGMWLVLGLGNRMVMRRFVTALPAVSSSACIMRIVKILNEPLFQEVIGDPDNPVRFLVSGNACFIVTLLLAAAAAAYIIHAPRAAQKNCTAKRYRMIVQTVMCLGIGACVLLLVLQLLDAVPLPAGFGTNRVLIWKISSAMYRHLPFGRKLIGVGPDCYQWLNLSDQEVRLMMYQSGMEILLPNAHSELLTMMIDLGALGTSAFLSVILSHVFQASSQAASDDMKLRLKGTAVILMTAGVMISFLVYFQHILLMPYVWILLSGVNSAGNKQDEVISNR